MTVRARTTLGDLHRATPWVWLNCEKCPHHAPLVCAVYREAFVRAAALERREPSQGACPGEVLLALVDPLFSPSDRGPTEMSISFPLRSRFRA
jgi:hypothetical protein